ncbi:ABC transporter permease [Gryllotalpicola ginsengisoli]|uniref:ABC transporter permease n=1 Tax=Gryllotalpicola ginsengisoli TaxID=444608 RepID=UPI0003B6CF2F|nr:ABC transporter permease subunit [Gryllotalpicola ginsengisoli]
MSRRGSARVGAAPGRATATVVLVIAGLAFLYPLYALAAFAFQPVGQHSGFTLQHLKALTDPVRAYQYDQLWEGIQNSLVIALVTVLLMLVFLLPAMILAELRYRRVRQAIEFVCLLPISIPTVVLAVGFIPVYQVMWQATGSVAWILAFAIGIISLPYAFRPIQSNMAGVDMVTLQEAARSLGAGWFQTVWSVILPNLRRGILSSALLTVSVVLGEYTIASFLQQNTFQTGLALLEHADPYVASTFALAALLFVFIILVLIGAAGTIRRNRKVSTWSPSTATLPPVR